MGSAGIDESAVEAWVADLGIGATGPLTFKRIGNGQSNLTNLITDAGGAKWVLRRPPLGTLLASAHDVVREHRILSALQGSAVPVPKVLGLTEDPAITDAPLMLMSFVDGTVVDDVSVAETLSVERRAAIGASLTRTLGRIHAVDLESAGLDDLASHKPYAERQLRRWSGQWEKSKTREVPAVEQLATRLHAAIPEQHELTLVHGDFHMSNVITSNDDGQVVAVVDWELCTLGDPLADIGALLAYWPEQGENYIGQFMSSTLPGFPSRAELAAAYFAETGRDAAALGFWHTLALWKVGIIAEGVLRRLTNDPRNAAAVGPTAELVDDIIERAVISADQYQL
ncbi:phosphotransferase family protein [Antrihabitans cavernicola]|uniref:Phosphotransferase family protein n=1 Tax=Antrihabitans cavernicola TaxID=2495913 RepID=A0A5A7SD53_9NOCA|nr:phosphotransferase family protein [Spelaeibacter cavernicola]KAA0022425.1 phosphotransferase family protein [Spelaeibacter cavernicola]